MKWNAMKSELENKLRRFMVGRNGPDQLTVLLLTVSLLMSVFATIFKLPFLRTFYYIGLLLSVYRIFSANLVRRRRENQILVQGLNKINSWFRIQKRIFQERKTHRHFKCPNCKQRLRVPKGRGKLSIVCSKCNEKFTRTS